MAGLLTPNVALHFRANMGAEGTSNDFFRCTRLLLRKRIGYDGSVSRDTSLKNH